MGLLLGLSGKARSGKDTLGDYLSTQFGNMCGEEVHTMAFADELKDDLFNKFDLSFEQLHGNLKEVPDTRYRRSDDTYWTPRAMMQAYGQFMRELDSDYWVKKLFDKVDVMEYKHIIITDLRQLNEVNSILGREGFHIKVVRLQENTLSEDSKNHSTEIELEDNYVHVDYTIFNDGSIEDLYEKADAIINDIWRKTKWLQRKVLA